MHMMMAGMFKAPGLLLTQEEAHGLAEATLNVQRHYPQFQAAQKTIDWVNLCTALVMIYGTRIMAAKKANSFLSMVDFQSKLNRVEEIAPSGFDGLIETLTK